MIGSTETALTLGGFLAIATLVMGAVALALNASSKTADLRERLAKLETWLQDHIRNEH